MKFKLFKIFFINLTLVVIIPTIVIANSKNKIYIDFKNFENTKRYNSYILCPKDYCKNLLPNKLSPKYKISMLELKSILIRKIYNSKRVKFVRYQKNHYQFIQKSKIFRFPDIIDVKFINSGEYVTFIIYSRSKYGFFDFNVNKNRVKEWLFEVNANVNEGLN